MNGWTVAGFLVGWILGTWMSWRKIQAERRARLGQLGKAIWKIVEDAEVINITVTDEGEKEITIDQNKLDELLGKDPTEH